VEKLGELGADDLERIDEGLALALHLD